MQLVLLTDAATEPGRASIALCGDGEGYTILQLSVVCVYLEDLTTKACLNFYFARHSFWKLVEHVNIPQNAAVSGISW